MGVEISRAAECDLDGIAALALRLRIPGRAGGRPYRRRHYAEFLHRSRWFFTAREGVRTAGVLLAHDSGQIAAGDAEAMLLRYLVRGDFILMRQLFADPEYAGRGIDTRLCRLLADLAPGDMPLVFLRAERADRAGTAKSIAQERESSLPARCGFTRLGTLRPVTSEGTSWLRSAWMLPAREGPPPRLSVRMTDMW